MRIPFISKYLEKRSAANYVSAWFSGIDISEMKFTAEDAIQLSAVYRCISLLAENTASMPLPIYENTDKGRIKVKELQSYKVLNYMANPYSTAFDFRSAMMWQCCLYGEAYAEKVRNKFGDVVELWLIPSKRVNPVFSENKMAYEVKMPDGSTVEYPAEKMFRITWATDNGLTGLRPLQLFRHVFELTANTDYYANAYFKNGGAPSGVVTHNIEDADEQKQMKEDFKQAYTGKKGAHRIIFLQEGMSFTSIASPPNQAQMIESRKFNVIEICRLYNIQPHKVFEMENTIKSNIEESGRDFIVTTLIPWARRWEQSVYRDILVGKTKNNYYAEMNFDSLLRGDTTSRYGAYAIARQWGFMSANDIRERENMPLIDNGDIYLTPMNMYDSKTLSNEAQPTNKVDDIQTNTKKIEKRSVQENGAKARAKLAERHRPVFENAGTRISKRQSNEVKAAAKKYLQKGETQQFKAWVAEYFENSKDWVKRDIYSESLSLASAITDLAASQVDGQSLEQDELEKTVEEYVSNFAEKNTQKKAAQLDKIIVENIQEENLEELIDERADEWKEKDPNKIALNETVFIASMIGRLTFKSNGYQKLVFINTSGKPCPFCAQLDGKVVGIAEPIIPEGDSVLADDGSNMKIYGVKMHTPIHRGCQCDLAPE